MTKDNHSLGKFDLTGLPKEERGVPQIEMIFDIDANGILNVSSKVTIPTGEVSGVQIIGDKCRLGKDEIEKMTKEEQEGSS